MVLGYYDFTVGAADDGMMLRTFLRRQCGLSARSLTVIKYDGGSISCEGKELRARDVLQAGMCIAVRLPQETCEITPIEGALDILYEDDRLLIINKPAAKPVHPTKVHQLDTLANLVSFYQQQRGEAYTFRALNRLDKDTSGCVLVAKDRISYALLQPTVKKIYTAVCEGVLRESGVIDKPIALATDSKIKRCINENGAHAVTHFEPVQNGNNHTLCRVWLETGRTHQIRCHMSAIGHPLAGDDLYGGSKALIGRQALHCQEVEFRHPDTGEEICLSTKTPASFIEIIDYKRRIRGL